MPHDPPGHPVATRDPVTELFHIRHARRVQVLAALAVRRRRRRAIRARRRAGQSLA